MYQDITNGKVATYDQAKHAYELQNGLPLSTLKEGDAVMNDVSVDGAAKALGKDGKEYTGKKRGRKSNADKLREAEEAGVAAGSDPTDLQAIAKLATEGAAAVKKEKKKEKKPVAASASKAKSPAKAVVTAVRLALRFCQIATLTQPPSSYFSADRVRVRVRIRIRQLGRRRLWGRRRGRGAPGQHVQGQAKGRGGLGTYQVEEEQDCLSVRA